MARWAAAAVLALVVTTGCAEDRLAFGNKPPPQGGGIDHSLPKMSLVDAVGFRTKAHMNYHRVQKEQAYSKLGQMSVSKKLIGTFITPCEPFNCLVNGNPHRTIPCSSTSAERIESDNTVTTDITIYVENYNCQPNASEVLAKVILTSNIIYRTPSTAKGNEGGQLVIYNATTGNFTFNYQKEDGDLIGELNQNCPCQMGHNPQSNQNTHWQSGVTRELKPTDCGNGKPLPVHSMSELCNLVVGNPFYQTYKWVDGLHYIQSEGSFNQNEGWNMPLNMSYVVALLPESASKTPQDCDYIRWPKCQEGIQNSKGVCDSCFGLECELCIFRELPSALGKEYEWNECCPCLYYEADTDPAKLSWMRVNC